MPSARNGGMKTPNPGSGNLFSPGLSSLPRKWIKVPETPSLYLLVCIVSSNVSPSESARALLRLKELIPKGLEKDDLPHPLKMGTGLIITLSSPQVTGGSVNRISISIVLEELGGRVQSEGQ